MSPARQANPELDNLIDEITADAHDEDEQLMGFEKPSTRTPASRAPAPSSARTSRCYPSPPPTTVAS
jgi:hypothetical protein